MLQTLGEEAVNGTKKLHPVLEEAIENRELAEDTLDRIINAVKDGSLLRRAGD